MKSASLLEGALRLPRGPSFDKIDQAVRLTEFWKAMADDSVAVIVSHPERQRSHDTEFGYRQSSDVLYLNGFQEPDSVLIICKIGARGKLKQRFIMLVLPKDREREIWTGIRTGVDGARADFLADEAHPIVDFTKVVSELVSKAKNVYYRFGVNEHFDELFEKIWRPTQKTLINPEQILHEMRMFKTEKELAIMRHAAAISATAHRFGMQETYPGMMEYQLQAIIEYVFRLNGASAPAYGSIVGSGNNAVILHYRNNDAEMKDGDIVLVDAACEFGSVAGGYASDITRCWPVNGKFTAAQAEIYQVVLDAQEAAIKAVRPGVPLARIHQTASRVMRRGLVRLGILPAGATAHAGRKQQTKKAEKGRKKDSKAKKPLDLRDFFMHGTSHWMGLDVHDVGRYGTADGTRNDKGKGKRRLLEPGMVFTIEPGLYFDKDDKRVPAKYRGIGIRIEDDVVVTKAGCENLTSAVPKSIAEIEALMERA